MNTTKGEWRKTLNAMSEKDRLVQTKTQIICRLVSEDYGTDEEMDAVGESIALAGNLNQKYDLSKLEELVENLRYTFETDTADHVLLELHDFLSFITRQPAGEKQTT